MAWRSGLSAECGAPGDAVEADLPLTQRDPDVVHRLTGVQIRGAQRWGLLFRTLWIGVFTPILLGLLAAGILGHPVFLLVFLIWLATLACVLRAEALNAKARGMQSPSPGLLGARAGWVLLALVLIFASAGLIRLVLG